MPLPLLILHAGPHKTGSTALQLRLLTARDYLQQHGYDYPLLGLSQFGHHHINAFLRGQTASAGGVTEDALRALGGEGRNIILSSEDLVYQPPESLERLKALFPGHRIQVILFIRNPVELWPSHWQELVKHGRPISLLEYVGAYVGLNAAFNPRDMQPVHQGMRFSQAFGGRQVRFFCYNNIVADGIDLFEFFLETVLGLPPLLPRLPTVGINKSLPPHTIELLRCLNERYHEHHRQSPQSRLTAAYQRRREQIESEPRYRAFVDAFEHHARSVTLDSSSELLRRWDRTVLRLLGDRIENLANPDKLFSQTFKRIIPYGTPYWIDRCGMLDYIDLVLDLLSREAVPPGPEAAHPEP